MPSSEEKFSRPPSGEELSAEDVKELMSGKAPKEPTSIEQVAEALGGEVLSKAVKTPEAAEDSRKETDVDNTKRTDKVDEDDRKEYLRTLLAGESFVKRYTIYGGNIHVTFKTRSVTTNDQVDIECMEQAYRPLIEAKSLPVVKERIRMCKTIIEIFIGGTAIRMPLTLESIDNLDEVMFSGIRSVYREFEELCDILFEMANDPDFWNQTVGAT